MRNDSEMPRPRGWLWTFPHMFGLVTALLLGACSPRHEAQPSPVPRVVYLADVSSSVRGEAMQAICLSAFRRVVAYVARSRGTATVEVIDGNPMQNSRTPIDVRFAVPPQFADNPVYADQILSKLEASTLAQMSALLAEPVVTHGTDVLTGVELAGRVFHRPPIADDQEAKYLVVCSDLLNSIRPFNLYRLNLTEAKVTALIKQLRKAGRLPDLSRVHVYVVGGGQPTAGRVTSGKARQVEAFFAAYFEAAGADLVQYAGTLPSFP